MVGVSSAEIHVSPAPSRGIGAAMVRRRGQQDGNGRGFQSRGERDSLRPVEFGSETAACIGEPDEHEALRAHLSVVNARCGLEVMPDGLALLEPNGLFCWASWAAE